MSCLFICNGGLGKHIMATSMMAELAEVHDHVYVISPYQDVFLACPSVDKCFLPGDPAIKDLILDDSVKLITTDPYDHSDFIRHKVHVLDAWRDIVGLPAQNETDLALPSLNPMRVPFVFDNYTKIFKDVKEPFILLQFYGGQSCLQLNNNYQPRQEALKRNYPYATELVRMLQERYPDVALYAYSLPTEPLPDGVKRFDAHYLHFRLLASRALAVICIDSSLQHLCTGVNDNVYVIWGETRPEHFGWSCNHNLAKPLDEWSPYFRPLGPSLTSVDFPLPYEIVKALKL